MDLLQDKSSRSDVKLTKFSSSAGEDNKIKMPNVEPKVGDEFNASRELPYGQSDTPSGCNAAKSADPEDCGPFRVIWRRLSFEVDVNTCGRLVSKAKEVWFGLSGQASAAESKVAQAQHEYQKRIVFENVNGHFNSGEITAILGPSGAGKTSLLNAICGHVKGYRGSLQLVGGGGRKMRLAIAPQKDYLMERLTVLENLLFASRMLNSEESFDHQENVARVVEMLNLTHCLGSISANISGGEYKRVSIGQELLRQPDILVLDEPTSGLDSLNCRRLVQSLKRIIETSGKRSVRPIAILMTIHQPDVDVFHMFDHVFCMARGGRVIFEGHPNEALDVVRQQTGQLVASGMQVSANPANLLIDIASELLYGKAPAESLSRYQLEQIDWMDRSAKLSTGDTGRARPVLARNLLVASNFTIEPHQTIDLDENGDSIRRSKLDDLEPQSLSKWSGASPTSSGYSTAVGPKEDCPPSWLIRDKRLNSKPDHSGQFVRQTKLLAGREFASNSGDPMMTLVSLLYHLTIPFALWTVYSHQVGSVRACPLILREMDIVSLASNRTAAIQEDLQEQLLTAIECSTMFYLSTYCFSLCAISLAALAFPLNMHILLKEARNGWYGLHSYVLAKTLANFPFEVVPPVMSLVMIYSLMGMPSSHLEWRLWAVALVTALTAMISSTQGLLFGSLCMENVQTAVFLAIASTLPQLALSGFAARIKHMPYLLQKLSWSSVYRYSSDTINIIRFGLGICPCNSATDEYLRTRTPTFGDISSSTSPLFTYYLGTTSATADDTDTLIETIATGNSTILDQSAHTLGVSYDLKVSASERNQIIARLEANELDFFAKLAELMSRSFAYGREVSTCDSVRSQSLTALGTPTDDQLLLLLGGMLALLIAAKLVLLIIVSLKIGSRS